MYCLTHLWHRQQRQYSDAEKLKLFERKVTRKIHGLILNKNEKSNTTIEYAKCIYKKKR